MWPSSASIRPWLSMTPVDGDRYAATQASSGSSAAPPPPASALHVVDAVPRRRRCDRVELADLLGLRGDEQLAAAPVRDAVSRTES